MRVLFIQILILIGLVSTGMGATVSNLPSTKKHTTIEKKSQKNAKLSNIIIKKAFFYLLCLVIFAVVSVKLIILYSSILPVFILLGVVVIKLLL